MADKNLKDLPPEERIKKLKELEAQKKKEIEDAQKQIKESEQEIIKEKKWKEIVPIPQVAQESLEGLSAEGKEILKNVKGKKEDKKGDKDEEKEGEKKKDGEKVAEKVSEKEELSLEETLMREKAAVSSGAQVQYELPRELHPNHDYVRHLSETPAERLKEEAQSLYNAFKERGYMNDEEQKRAAELYTASDLKERAGDGGLYPSFTEEVAEKTSLVKQIAGHLLHNMYRAKKSGNEMYR